MLSDANTKANADADAYMDSNANTLGNSQPDELTIYFSYVITHSDAVANRHAVYITDGHAYRISFLYFDAEPEPHIESGFD